MRPKREEVVMQPVLRQRFVVAAVLSAGLGMSSGARADGDQHVTGVTTGPGNPGTVIVQVVGSPTPVTVVVDDSTKVRRSGIMKRNGERTVGSVCPLQERRTLDR